MIDHTLLKPEATLHEITALCAEAREHGFYSVCVNGSRVGSRASSLENSPIKVTTVVGFPWAQWISDAKRYETEAAIDHGQFRARVINGRLGFVAFGI